MVGFEDALRAEMQRYSQSIIEQLNQPLWFLGPQPDHLRWGWPREYVLFPRVRWVERAPTTIRCWWNDRAVAAWDVLRHGLPERDD